MAWYWSGVVLLIVMNTFSLFGNLLMLPGNWVMVGSLALFAGLSDSEASPTWSSVFVCVLIAMAGEIAELVTGSAKASQRGASRRAMFLSLVFSIIGSIAGTFLIPIPVIGSAFGAVAGAAIGAFGGAWLGEAWKGSESEKRMAVGSAAMSGRMLGMLVKFTAGVAIYAFQLATLFL